MHELQMLIRSIFRKRSEWSPITDDLLDLINSKKYPEEEIKKEVLDFMTRASYDRPEELINYVIPLNIKETEQKSKEIRDRAIKLPKKPFRLKEGAEEERSIAGKIYIAGLPIVKVSPHMEFLNKGKEKNFDYKKGLDDIIRFDKNGTYIRAAGEHWPIFDFEKGFRALVALGKDGEYNLWMAGREWKNFDETRILDIFKKENPESYKTALKYWPGGIKLSQLRNDIIKNQAKKLPKKPFKLQEAIKIISKELLDVPPHYETDGYKVIITMDLNETNINQFVNKFRAGRILSYGSLSSTMDEFAKEIVFKTILRNKLRVNSGFYFCIYEDL
jgi:hypothetical protein